MSCWATRVPRPKMPLSMVKAFEDVTYSSAPPQRAASAAGAIRWADIPVWGITGRSSPAVSQFLSILLTLLFLSLDGHLVLVDMVAKSYRALPPGAAWMTAGQMRDIALFGGYAFLAGLLLALPVGFLLLCQNIVMGMLSRSAPALNLFSVGLPASLAVGVITLGIALPAMGDYMQVIVREGLAAAQSLVLLTTGGF